MIHPGNQRMMAERMNPKRLIQRAGRHASLASRPEEVADLIDLAVEGTGV
jgi:hypothetical protein